VTPALLLRRVWYRLNRSRLDRELEREMASHRAMMAEPQRFGSALRLREQSADIWGWAWLDDLGRDLRYGSRQLIAAPRFTVAAMSILTLGAGVALAVLHVANAANFHPLAVADADRLVRVSRRSPEITSTFPFAAAAFYQQHSSLFSYLVSESLGPRVSVDDDPAPRVAAFVSANYFHDLRVVADRGRLPDGLASRPGAPPIAALGYRYWQQHFDSDPAVVGRIIRVNGAQVQITGVVPSTFDGLGPPRTSRVDIWMPMAVRAQVVERSHAIDEAGPSDTAIYGVLGPGATLAAATAQLRTLTEELRRQEAAQLATEEPIQVRPLRDPARFEADVALLFALFFLIFFSACANLGNMLLARGLARSREIGLRVSLGASRWRVVRQLTTENLLLAVLGCVAGSAAGYAGAKLLLRYWGDIPAGVHIVVDWRMVLASIALIGLAMLGFGLTPALQAVRQRQTSNRMRQTLVAVQVAASVVLLIVATLLARGNQRMDEIDLALDYRRTIAVDPQLTARTLEPAAQWALIDDMTERLERLPGVDSVTAAIYGPVQTGLPLMGQQVAPSYFATLRLPVLRGRVFAAREPEVVMVSESGARALWPDRDALGQTWTDPRSGASRLVVGIVKDSGLSARRNGAGESYIPLSDERLSRVVLLAHTQGDPRALLRDARAAAAPAGLTPSATPMEATLNLPRPAGAALIGILGSMATLLAFTGIFGLVTFAVAQRTREIGVRMALGARRTDVLATVLAQYASPVVTGSAAGVVLALAGSQVVRSQLQGLSPLDPLSYAAGIGGLGLATLAAMLMPAWRALRINPASALRSE
jgi:predicted permease